MVCQNSSVGVATRLWAGRPSYILSKVEGFFSYRDLPLSYPMDPGGNAGGVKLTTHLCLMLRLRMVELYLHSPIYLPSVVLNYVINCRENVNFLCRALNRKPWGRKALCIVWDLHRGWRFSFLPYVYNRAEFGGFWWCCITVRIIRFLDTLHCLVF
jgi:hypothetical protein